MALFTTLGFRIPSRLFACGLLCVSTSSLFAQHPREDGAFLASVEDQRATMTQIIEVSVARQISKAREVMSAQPAQAVIDLKQALDQVEAAPGLAAEVRAQLRVQLVRGIKEAQRREVALNERQQLSDAREAAGKQRERVLREATRKEERTQQIIARYNALLNEWRFRAAEDAAMDVRDVEPHEPAMVAAVLNSRNQGYVHDMMQVRERRQKGVVDALYASERAQVPFSDDPPIVYPHAQVWEELTSRRRKYAAMSLEKQGSAEEQIFAALSQSTTLEFIDTPLRDVIDYLKDLHGIEIQIDYRALEEVGIGPDAPVTRNLKGITLRSALKLMLRELDLTYTVQDEVLLITTQEVVAEHLTAKVYPVADLVLPINPGATANPFQMGAGLGNQGAFGGGMNQQPGGFNNGPANVGPIF